MSISLTKRFAALLGFFLPSVLTRPLMRLAGHKVGKGTKLPFLSYICAEHMELGNDVDIRPLVFIDVNTLSLGSNTIVSYGAQIKGDRGFACGDNCMLGPHSTVHCEEDVRLGFYSCIGPRSMVYTHGSFLPVTLGYPALFAAVVLEDFVWIAMGVTLLPGAYVESNCIINPGVIVSGRVPTGTRLQLSRKAVQSIPHAKLIRFAKRSPAYYHQAIVRGFLQADNAHWTESDDHAVFSWGADRQFRSCAATNRIELWTGNTRTAVYDLERFRVTASRDTLHRRFLAHPRRRFGVTLRTAHSPDPQDRTPL